MLEELLKEIGELIQYKERYELANKDKEKMSALLYSYMMKEYRSTSKEENMSKYKNESCKCCKYNNFCDYGLPEDIMKPIPSKDAWIPSRVSCEHFMWS